MPSYSYKCSKCEKNWTSFHGINEKEEKCPECTSTEIVKLFSPSIINKTSTKTINERDGVKKRVEKFIEDSRQVLQEQMAEARKEHK